MRRNLAEVLTDINSSIETNLVPAWAVTYYLLCNQQEKDGKTFPLENQGAKNGRKISLDDRKPLQIYHRLLEQENIIDYAVGKGSKPGRFRLFTMRMVGLGWRNLITSESYEDNADLAIDVFEALPNFLNSTEYIEIVSEETDKQTVLEEEFPGYDQAKALNLEYVAFYCDYTIRQRSDC
jgi:hypothetical protein